VTTTITLNADGSLTSYLYTPDAAYGSLGLLQVNQTSVANLQSLESGDASIVLSNGGSTSLTLNAANAVALDLAVQGGLLTATTLETWATAHNVQVSNIFTGTPVQGGATITEGLVAALNDPLLTTDGNIPTLTQTTTSSTTLTPVQIAEATASTELAGQVATMPATGPASIAGVGAATYEVEQAYVAYYGRPADPAGLAYWTQQLNAANGNLNSIINGFGNSAESQALYSGQNATQIITSIYQQEFNRAPDASGLAYWQGQLTSGAVSAAAAALAIFQGAMGADQTLVDNKLVAAQAFVNALSADSTATSLYNGTTATINARIFLASVDTTTAHTVALAGVASQAANDIQNGTNLAADISGTGVALVGTPTTAATVAAHQVLG